MSTQSGNVVVGVDGSDASRAALRWAVERAAADGGTVTAVEVIRPVRLGPGTSYAPAPYGIAPPLSRTPSRLHEFVDAARDAVPGAPTITELQVRGEPGIELTKAAEGGVLLVLGHIPHGRTTEFLFGQVVADCVRHARCPVVLVRAES
jgi:nucleotide-binding universal stress UspA family protein